MATPPAPAAPSTGQAAALACLVEATAPKPGNVHRGADFEDVGYFDFAASAVAVVPAFDRAAAGARLGETLLEAVRATRRLAGTNTNLGMLLLLAPLAMVPRGEPLSDGVRRVLAGLDARDARDAYQAIREARPGGLGSVEAWDVEGDPPDDLLAAMRLAADRDTVARQYAEGFRLVLGDVRDALRSGLRRDWPLGRTVVLAYLELLARVPDTLIGRKCGPDVAREASARAAAALAAGAPGDEASNRALADLDFWLRSDGHRRNPGTTADLITAGLFALIRDQELNPPFSL